MATGKLSIKDVRKAAAKHGGTVIPDGCGGYEVAAPEGMRWKAAEVCFQPLPLHEAQDEEERQDMLDTGVWACSEGTIPYDDDDEE